MVMFEYIPYGDLLGFLRKSRGLSDNYYKDPDVKPSSSLSSKQLLKFAREIADGMAFLAANKVLFFLFENKLDFRVTSTV